MHTIVKGTLVALGALALAAPAVAQQQGGQQPPRQGAQQPPPQQQGAQQGGQQGGPPRQGGGGGFGGPPAPPNTGVPVYTALRGPVGSGHITVVIDPPKGTACYLMNVTGLDRPTAAHIHRGGEGENGPPVLPLETPSDGSAGACPQIAADLAQAILANPAGYYVNVHTAALPNGALRGQLAK